MFDILTLSQVASTDEHASNPSVLEQTDKAVASQIVILVVEDNIGNFKLIARLLGTLGVQCEWKTSG